MRIGDSSSEQSDAMVDTPLLTQRFVHPDVSPSSTARPSATPDDTMHEVRHNLVIMTTFERKASAKLSSWLKKVWDTAEHSNCMLPHIFDELDLKGIGSSSQAETLDSFQIAAMSAQIAQLTSTLTESERRREAEQRSMSKTVQQIKEQVMNLARRPTTSAPDDTNNDSDDEDDYIDPSP
ncbi:hypothetical protein MTR67_012333 [Solanum verrucosum]|uniref:Uncharacterized protein n=1 Tax=Solanum verrucosum TaxID=315347 RepID=A0AAF0QA58_SOLVR|nr:hypothetical protein MTR67_012333 [Solanum verrucosum]